MKAKRTNSVNRGKDLVQLNIDDSVMGHGIYIKHCIDISTVLRAMSEETKSRKCDSVEKKCCREKKKQ